LRNKTDAIYDAVMRTTIDLPDDLHRAATLIARDRHQTLSRTVASLLRSALAGGQQHTSIEVDPDSGLPTVRVGRRITAQDVAAADEDG
jgi:predicted transcriptional regulator